MTEALYAAPCEFKTVSFPRNGVTVGCKIPVARCSTHTREEYFTDRTLKVRLSLDTEIGAPTLPGMEQEFDSAVGMVKVSGHSVSSTHVSFSLKLDATDITAEFAQQISNRPGSLFVLEANSREDDAGEIYGDEEFHEESEDE